MSTAQRKPIPTGLSVHEKRQLRTGAVHASMTTHGTPGPFVVREEKRFGDEPRITVQASNGVVLAELSCYSTAERSTLAHQFASAPELLAMLKHMVRWHDQLKPADSERAQALIATHEGGAS